jgi:hypothetical protein
VNAEMVALYWEPPTGDLVRGTTDPRKGALMSAAQQSPTLDSYRNAVEDLMDAGEGFGDVEDAIDEVDGLTRDQKAALWLFAFSLRDRAVQQLDARAHLAAVA